MSRTRELTDVLQDVTAALENSLLQFGDSMYPSDKSSRWAAVNEAYKLLSLMEGKHEPHLSLHSG